MKYLCQTGVDYDECKELVQFEGDYCPNCSEAKYSNFLDDFYGGSSAMTLDEQINEAKKLK